MKAIVDCNSFYCSCERLFQPALMKKPVIVLSNNDGCIISRTDEAKNLGVEMAGPYFKAKPLIRQFDIATFSSNYHLYGDLSMRVMDSLRELVGDHRVEVYSVDEAFLDLDMIPPEHLLQMARATRETVEQWTGISVSVGVAPTKVLAKVANRVSKKNKQVTGCVTVLDTEEKIAQALQDTPVGDVWGVGRQYARKLREQWSIYDALQLRDMGEEFGKNYLGGVTGSRLIRELQGIESIDMEEPLVTKKMIATTRMFGQPVTAVQDIREAVATYTSRAAEKLRRQHCVAGMVSVFVVPKEETYAANFHHGPSVEEHVSLPIATSSTHELIKPAMQLVEQIFENGRVYKKAGVMLSALVPDNSIQSNLFLAKEKNESKKLMDMLDNVNFSMRDDVLKFASSGTARDWKMRQELRSPRYTTRWDELRTVR
jgi:DNA polymerase V